MLQDVENHSYLNHMSRMHVQRFVRFSAFMPPFVRAPLSTNHAAHPISFSTKVDKNVEDVVRHTDKSMIFFPTLNPEPAFSKPEI